ncbi:chordin-like protein 2 [Loxodonta africana]|uniref:chordin-like protein 2 n=1 Tax=Loxodonta africana TaxID=9785 RepID=UPI0030CF879B
MVPEVRALSSLLGLALLWFPLDSHARARPDMFCLFHGKRYSPGESWHPYLEPQGLMYCLRCTCSESAHVSCYRLHCPPVHCPQPVTEPQQCCPRCVEPHTPSGLRAPPKSCQHNGTIYQHGEIFSARELFPSRLPNQCVLCSCTEGQIYCGLMTCPEPGCPAPLPLPDSCCQACKAFCFSEEPGGGRGKGKNLSISHQLPLAKGSPQGVNFSYCPVLHACVGSWKPWEHEAGVGDLLEISGDRSGFRPWRGKAYRWRSAGLQPARLRRPRLTQLPFGFPDGPSETPAEEDPMQSHREVRHSQDLCSSDGGRKRGLSTPAPTGLSSPLGFIPRHFRPKGAGSTTVKIVLKEKHKKACVHGGKTYSHGEVWNPAFRSFGPLPCILCTCRDGHQDCQRVTCPTEYPCHHPEKVAGKCCKICPEDKADPGHSEISATKCPKAPSRVVVHTSVSPSPDSLRRFALEREASDQVEIYLWKLVKDEETEAQRGEVPGPRPHSQNLPLDSDQESQEARLPERGTELPATHQHPRRSLERLSSPDPRAEGHGQSRQGNQDLITKT